MYSWTGQLYTALITGYQGIKGISAGLTGFSGEKIAYIFLPTNYWDFFCPRIALMDTKAMRYGNGDRVGRTNLHQCNDGACPVA